MMDRSDKELRVDLLAKRECLVRNPAGMAALATKRRIKEIEREVDPRQLDRAWPQWSVGRVSFL
jgi:hypothetical protein